MPRRPWPDRAAPYPPLVPAPWPAAPAPEHEGWSVISIAFVEVPQWLAPFIFYFHQPFSGR